jgi:hypothetical protein
VFPQAKFSYRMPIIFNLTRIRGTAPEAFILNEVTAKIRLPAVVARTGRV